MRSLTNNSSSMPGQGNIGHDSTQYERIPHHHHTELQYTLSWTNITNKIP